MSKDNSFSRKDLSATMWAITFAMFSLAAAMAFSPPLSTVILSGILGAILGQIFARWLFKHDPSIVEEKGPAKPHAVLKYSAGLALAVAGGLFVAYLRDAQASIVIFVAGGALFSAIIAFGFLSSIVARYFERNDRN